MSCFLEVITILQLTFCLIHYSTLSPPGVFLIPISASSIGTPSRSPLHSAISFHLVSRISRCSSRGLIPLFSNISFTDNDKLNTPFLYFRSAYIVWKYVL